MEDKTSTSFFAFSLNLWIMANLDATLGAMEIGVAVACYLFGILTLQTFVYFKNNLKDSSILRSLVTVVYCFQLAQTICILHAFYIMSIKRYGSYKILLSLSPASLTVAGYLGATVDFLVQVFYANRVRRCCKTPYVAIICWVLASLRFVAYIIATAFSILTPSFGSRYFLILHIVWADGILVDTIITASLCYYLAKGRQRSTSRRTIMLVDRIIAITISTGLVTSVIAIAIMICSMALPDTYVFLAMAIIEPDLFANCFLASLNGRSILRDMQMDVQNSFPPPRKPHSVVPAIEIKMSQVIEVDAIDCYSSDTERNEHKRGIAI